MSIFVVFPFPKSAGRDCDVAMVVLALVDTPDVVGDIVGVPEGVCGMET